MFIDEFDSWRDGPVGLNSFPPKDFDTSCLIGFAGLRDANVPVEPTESLLVG